MPIPRRRAQVVSMSRLMSWPGKESLQCWAHQQLRQRIQVDLPLPEAPMNGGQVHAPAIPRRSAASTSTHLPGWYVLAEAANAESGVAWADGDGMPHGLI